MSARRVLVVGAGRRVLSDVLPAFASLPEAFEVVGVRARSARAVEAGGTRHEVTPLTDALPRCDLVYVCVAKPAVPGVLARLAGAGADLLIDTPVLLFRHLAALRRLRRFRRVWVSEDCSTLPWIGLVRAAVGTPREVVFDRSAYHYHGLAMTKALLGCRDVVAARRRDGRVELRLANGARGTIVEPRDYAVGRLTLAGDGGTAGDADLVLERDGERCVALRAGESREPLAPEESALLGPVADGDTIVTRMEAFKRVGLRRMLATVAAGGEGYPLLEGLDDMAIDYALEKLGRWRATPFTSIKSPLARLVGRTRG